MDINKTIDNLRRNHMNVIVAKDRQAVQGIVKELIPENSVVTHGGSVTLAECGIPTLLKEGNYRYLDRSTAKDPRQIYLSGYSADYYLTSANAITENGELYNVDGNSNRISAIAYGPSKVIVIAGINKIVADLDEAIIRVKTIAAPKNAARLHCPTYCAEKGRCISLQKAHASMTDGCDSPARICCNYLISGPQRDAQRITVILVEENIGY